MQLPTPNRVIFFRGFLGKKKKKENILGPYRPKSIHIVIVKLKHKFVNLLLSFLNGHSGYNIKNSHTGVPNPYEFLALKKKKKN